jgi:hypothetical protein
MHAASISPLLQHLADAGFLAPVLVGSDDEGRQVFRWIEGEVPVSPYPSWSIKDDVLTSVGALLRRYHTAVCEFRPPPRAGWSNELADPQGGSLVCHNDVCPENVVFRDGHAVGLLDFDFAAPGRPVWDLAQVARMWIPLRPPDMPDERAALNRFERLALLAMAYGLDPGESAALVDAIIESKRIGSACVRRRVSYGESAFMEAWEAQGGQAGDDRAIAWLEANREHFVRSLSRDL